MQKKHSPIKNILLTLAFPVGMFLLMELLCVLAADRHVFISGLDIKNFIRNIGISVCTALALSFNLGSGRFDLSLGAQRMAATVIGANFAISMGFSSVGVILCAFVCGLLLGGLVGLIFVTFRVPPMVLGVGMTMVYECVALAGSNAEGLHLYGKGYEDLSEIWFTIAVVFIVTIIIMVLYKYSKFGYHMRAIQGSQRIAKNSGINIFLHAFGCYMFAGGLVSFSGVFDAAFKGSMSAELGMKSNASVMANCFPMFLGGYLARWSNQAVGILTATITLKLLSTGLSVMKLSTTTSELINMFLFLAFLVFRANDTFFADRKARNERIAQAHAKKAGMTGANAV